MEQLRSVCEDILEDVEGSLGCAAIDLETGSTLAAACRSDGVLNAAGVDVISVADRRGVSTVEYALIVVAVIGIVGAVAATMSDAFDDLFSGLTSEMQTGLDEAGTGSGGGTTTGGGGTTTGGTTTTGGGTTTTGTTT